MKILSKRTMRELKSNIIKLQKVINKNTSDLQAFDEATELVAGIANKLFNLKDIVEIVNSIWDEEGRNDA